MHQGHILVVEDEGIVALDIQNRLRLAGFTIAGSASSAIEAIQQAEETKPDLVLMDIRLQGKLDGIEAAQKIKEQFDIPVIYLTAYADEETLKRAKLTEAFGYLLKPFKERELAATIQMTLTRHQLERQLRESEQWFSTTLRSIGDAVIATDNKGRIKFMNPLAENLTGWLQAEAAGVVAEQVFRVVNTTTRKENLSPVLEVLQTGETVFLQNNSLLLARDGREIPVDDSAAPIIDKQGIITGVVLIFRDITERKQAETLIMQAHKMESLGVLAGGVAHDFNNLLVAILGQTSLAMAKSAIDSPVYQHLKKAVQATEQAAELTRQLLAYSGRGQFRQQNLCLNDLVRRNQQLFTATIPKKITVQFELDDTLPNIEADPAQLLQILMNLLLNASDAIGNQTGTVTLRTSSQTINATDNQYWQYTGKKLSPGSYVLLEVSDTGCGIAVEMMADIFEPFFSTKSKGRGLGLAAVLGIVRGLNGGLSVESQPGQGAMLKLVFPAATQEIPDAPVVEPEAERPLPSRRVLLIDDELFVHEAVTEILELENIQVLSALGGTEGVEAYANHKAEIDLVLLDLSMPDMNGAETYQKLREINPAIRVVLTSGYDRDDVVSKHDWQGLTDFLQKPYGLSVLLDCVNRYLNA